MPIRSLITASIFALCSIALTAQASSTWTLTSSGKITDGYDTTGVFGTVNRDLTGLSYTESITAIIDPAAYYTVYNDGLISELSGIGQLFTETVTVDGFTLTFATTQGATEVQRLDRTLSATGTGQDEINSYNSGHFGSGDGLRSAIERYSTTAPFLPTIDFSQTLVFGPLAAYDYVDITGSQTAYFYNRGESDFLLINQDTVNVPEPESIALLGLGLLALIASRKKVGK